MSICQKIDSSPSSSVGHSWKLLVYLYYLLNKHLDRPYVITSVKFCSKLSNPELPFTIGKTIFQLLKASIVNHDNERCGV